MQVSKKLGHDEPEKTTNRLFVPNNWEVVVEAVVQDAAMLAALGVVKEAPEAVFAGKGCYLGVALGLARALCWAETPSHAR